MAFCTDPRAFSVLEQDNASNASEVDSVSLGGADTAPQPPSTFWAAIRPR
ncbi:MAG: hypothetical protein JSV95_04815 [Gemmatimonadota bacterium]|nr:MAG: hypothetical protein JSV95_04815 [Gemmatimonadota bacterium]